MAINRIPVLLKIISYMERGTVVFAMSSILASVIIPTYNQFVSLRKTLFGFSLQNIPTELFEVIVVDDGSGDGLQDITSDKLARKYKLNIKVIHQMNIGRACARNAGINAASSNILIFCDGDRVPDQSFVIRHIQLQQSGYKIIVGSSYDYFGQEASLNENNIDWINVKRFSRLPNYFKRISKIYQEGNTESQIAWLSFLVGNSSVSKSSFDKVGLFNESFKEWGFEHFEFAYRAQKAGMRPYLDVKACNFHIPHKRVQNFYEESIKKNCELIKKMHPEINAEVLYRIIFSNDPVLLYEKVIFQTET